MIDATKSPDWRPTIPRGPRMTETPTRRAAADPAARRPTTDEVVGTRHGMFGVRGSGDTSGYGGLVRTVAMPAPASAPYGGWFDEVAQALRDRPRATPAWTRDREGRRAPRRDHVLRPPRGPADASRSCCVTTRQLRFEFCSGVSGVHYPEETGRELHAVYHLLSMTHNRRIRLEVTCPDADPHIPSIVRDLPDERLARARDLRLLRHRLRRPPRPDPHPDARRLAGPPAAQGLPAGRHPGGVQGRHHPAARRAEVVQLMAHDAAPDPYAATGPPPPRAGSSRSPARTGTRWSPGSPRRATTGRRQHGPAAPVHPRRAPADPRARGRDGDRGAVRDRLPAHGHREEHGVPLLGAGHHVLHPHGLPEPVLQRDDLLPRRRAAARHRGRHPREGPRDAGADDGAQPDLLPPGVHRHRWHGDRRAHRDDDRLPRARAGARPVRDDHRPADEPRVHPSRRRRPGPARRARSTTSARSPR